MLLTPFVWFHPSSYFVLSLTSWFERRWKSEGFLPLVLLRKRVSDVYSLVLSFFSLLFSSLFLFSLCAHTYARMNIIMCLSFQPFSPPRPFFKKMSRHLVMFQRFIFSFPKNFKKIVEYIWSVSEKRVLLHPLSRRGEPCGIDMMTKRRTA